MPRPATAPQIPRPPREISTARIVGDDVVETDADHTGEDDPEQSIGELVRWVAFGDPAPLRELSGDSTPMESMIP